jgi:uncharacterized membrane protein AbrB (regulator of aidB expression)
MIVAHVAGIPVEETLLGFAPLGLAGVAAVAAYVTQRARTVLRRARRRAGHPL